MAKNLRRKRRGRGEGGVFEHPKGGWAATADLGYDEHGKRRRKWVYGSTKAECLEKLRKLQTDVSLGKITDKERFTFGDYITLWLENTARVKVSPSTYARYEQHVRLHLKPQLGGIRLDKLTPFHVSQMYDRMERAGTSAAERMKTGKLLRQVLKAARRLQLVTTNAAEDILLPKPVKKEIQPLNADQSKRFLKAAEPDRLYALYVLAIDSGMRQGELFGLQWPDVDFAGGSVQVQRSLEEVMGHLRLKDTKTGSGRRRIELAPFTLDVLHEHRKRMLAEGHADGQAFCDTDGGFLRKSNFQRRSFNRVLKRAEELARGEATGLGTDPALLPDIRFHDLRHTCATLLLLADVNVKVVSERLGHRSIEITLNTYSHVLPTMQKGAAAKMQALLGR
jgi:integrase